MKKTTGKKKGRTVSRSHPDEPSSGRPGVRPPSQKKASSRKKGQTGNPGVGKKKKTTPVKKKTAQADRSSSTETRAKTRHTKKKSATGTKTSRVDSPANPGEGFNESEEIWFQEAPYSEQAKDALPRATPPLERNESGSEPEFFQGKPVNHSRDPVEMDLEIRNLISDLVMVLLETQDFVRLGQILEEYTDFIGDMKLLLKSRSS